MPARLPALTLPLAFAFALGGAAPSPPQRASGPLYVIVPFGEPGDTDPRRRDATDHLSHDLSDRGVRSAVAEPIDVVEAVGTAARVCERYDAGGMIVGRLDFEQSKERNLTGFLPVVGGVVSASGAFDASPLRARVKLYLVDCGGHVTWKTTTSADKVHHGTNVAAGLTVVEEQAVAAAAERFADRR